MVGAITSVSTGSISQLRQVATRKERKYGKEGYCRHQAAVPGSESHAGTPDRTGSWPSWSQRAKVRPGIQREIEEIRCWSDCSCRLSVYADRTFSFILKTPPASILIKKALGIQTASGTPNKTKVGKLTKAQLEDIAKQKLDDMNCNSLESAMKVVAGTARSMGVEVEK